MLRTPNSDLFQLAATAVVIERVVQHVFRRAIIGFADFGGGFEQIIQLRVFCTGACRGKGSMPLFCRGKVGFPWASKPAAFRHAFLTERTRK